MLDEFYKQIKELYPDISSDEIKLIVKSPFKLLRRTIEEGKCETVRIKKLGTFKVFKSTIIKIDNKYDRLRSYDKVMEKEYDRIKQITRNFYELQDKSNRGS